MKTLTVLYIVLYHVIFNRLPWYFKYLGLTRMRNFLFRKITRSGKNVSIGMRSNIMDISTLLKIGDNVSLGENFRFIGYNQPLIIGNNVIIGFDCVFITTQHNYGNRKINIEHQGYRNSPIIIEDDVFFGGRIYVMPGVRIGKGSYIGAASVVTKSVPEYSIVWGFPARVVKRR